MTSERGQLYSAFVYSEAMERVESDCSSDSDSVLSLSYSSSSFEGNENSDAVSESSEDRGFTAAVVPYLYKRTRGQRLRLQPQRTSIAKTKMTADLATVNSKESSCNQNPQTSYLHQLEIHHLVARYVSLSQCYCTIHTWHYGQGCQFYHLQKDP